jgi:hypothetical protein
MLKNIYQSRHRFFCLYHLSLRLTFSKHFIVTLWKCLKRTLKKKKNLNLDELCHFSAFLNRWCLLCVINFSHTFSLTFSKLCSVIMDTLKMCLWLSGSVQTFFKKFMYLNFVIYFRFFKWMVLLYLLCVINSSHTSRLTFSNFLEYLPSAFFYSTASIDDCLFKATQPFLFLNWFLTL